MMPEPARQTGVMQQKSASTQALEFDVRPLEEGDMGFLFKGFEESLSQHLPTHARATKRARLRSWMKKTLKHSETVIGMVACDPNDRTYILGVCVGGLSDEGRDVLRPCIHWCFTRFSCRREGVAKRLVQTVVSSLPSACPPQLALLHTHAGFQNADSRAPSAYQSIVLGHPGALELDPQAVSL